MRLWVEKRERFSWMRDNLDIEFNFRRSQFLHGLVMEFSVCRMDFNSSVKKLYVKDSIFNILF
jgi:hypothetical protein